MKEMSFWLSACVVLLYAVLTVCVLFPFGFWIFSSLIFDLFRSLITLNTDTLRRGVWGPDADSVLNMLFQNHAAFHQKRGKYIPSSLVF